MTGMLPFLIRRLLWVPPVLFAVSFATFALGRYGPGDPVLLRAGPRADEETIERIRHDLGFDDPVPVQYARYMADVAQGDFGESLARPGTQVSELIFPRLWISFQIGLIALVATFTLGIPLGLFAALKQGTWMDPFSISFFLAFQSVPILVLVPLLQLLFVLQFNWLPSGGWDGILSTKLILPVVALSTGGVAGVGRLMRTLTLSVLDEDYVRTARAKGLSEFTVVSRHIARNALLPMTTIIGLSLVTLLEGAFFTELLLGIPGIGQLTVTSVFQRDYDVIMAITLIIATTFVLMNILIDIVYTMINPRVRFESGKR